jgi:Leucine Rich repeat
LSLVIGRSSYNLTIFTILSTMPTKETNNDDHNSYKTSGLNTSTTSPSLNPNEKVDHRQRTNKSYDDNSVTDGDTNVPSVAKYNAEETTTGTEIAGTDNKKGEGDDRDTIVLNENATSSAIYGESKKKRRIAIDSEGAGCTSSGNGREQLSFAVMSKAEVQPGWTTEETELQLQNRRDVLRNDDCSEDERIDVDVTGKDSSRSQESGEQQRVGANEDDEDDDASIIQSEECTADDEDDNQVTYGANEVTYMGNPFTIYMGNRVILLGNQDPDVAKIVEELNDPSLHKLNINGQIIGAVGAIALADALQVNQSLQELTLDRTFLGDDGAVALADALRVNQSLQELVLFNTNIGDEGAVALADALRVNTSLQKLDLMSNDIGTDGAVALADALKVNQSLQKLGLRWNNIGDDGTVALADALRVN